MNDQLVLDTVRSLESDQVVTVEAVAASLKAIVTAVRPALDRLVADGALHTSVLHCRSGAHLEVRAMWFHTRESEVIERFGPIAGLVARAARPAAQTACPLRSRARPLRSRSSGVIDERTRRGDPRRAGDDHGSADDDQRPPRPLPEEA